MVYSCSHCLATVVMCLVNLSFSLSSINRCLRILVVSLLVHSSLFISVIFRYLRLQFFVASPDLCCPASDHCRVRFVQTSVCHRLLFAINIVPFYRNSSLSSDRAALSQQAACGTGFNPQLRTRIKRALTCAAYCAVSQPSWLLLRSVYLRDTKYPKIVP